MGATTQDDVRRACLGLPGVTERPSWGQPSWSARTLMARIWTPHHERSPQLVLVRLARVDLQELDELLQESYRIAGSRSKS